MSEQASSEILIDGVDKAACGSCGQVVAVAGKAPFSVVNCPKCNNKLAVPGRIGQFQVFKCLGMGATGGTYRGMDKFLKRPIAIKVMRRSLGQDVRLVESFFNEARILASLNHPNVAHVYTLGVEKDQPYIVMELVAGGRMDKLFDRDKPLAQTRALSLAIDVTEGLIATHEMGLVHGDVKPSNILLDAGGTAKLVDFGMARLAYEGAAGEGLAGTPYYIAPEQAQNLPTDFRADIYSLGATLFHALAGRPPFEGKTVNEVVTARLHKPAPDLAAIRPDLCRQTCATVARMLAAKPEDRYASYQDLLADLCDALKISGKQDLGQHVEPAQPHTQAKEPQPSPPPQAQAPRHPASRTHAPQPARPAQPALRPQAPQPSQPAPRPQRPGAPGPAATHRPADPAAATSLARTRLARGKKPSSIERAIPIIIALGVLIIIVVLVICLSLFNG